MPFSRYQLSFAENYQALSVSFDLTRKARTIEDTILMVHTVGDEKRVKDIEDVDYQSSKRLCNLSFLDYLKLYFFEYEHVALNSTRPGLDAIAIRKPTCLGRISKNLLDRVSQLH
ncbi:hypothetical protein Tco_0122439 [Tanacetum coccineum]